MNGPLLADPLPSVHHPRLGGKGCLSLILSNPGSFQINLFSPLRSQCLDRVTPYLGDSIFKDSIHMRKTGMNNPSEAPSQTSSHHKHKHNENTVFMGSRKIRLTYDFALRRVELLIV